MSEEDAGKKSARQSAPPPLPDSKNATVPPPPAEPQQDSSPTHKPPPPPDTKEPSPCRLHMWGKCTKGIYCRFRHEYNIEELKKVIKFCHNYQNKGCSGKCDYLHVTLEEADLFNATGQFPRILLERHAAAAAATAAAGNGPPAIQLPPPPPPPPVHAPPPPGHAPPPPSHAPPPPPAPMGRHPNIRPYRQHFPRPHRPPPYAMHQPPMMGPGQPGMYGGMMQQQMMQNHYPMHPYPAPNSMMHHMQQPMGPQMNQVQPQFPQQQQINPQMQPQPPINQQMPQQPAINQQMQQQAPMNQQIQSQPPMNQQMQSQPPMNQQMQPQSPLNQQNQPQPAMHQQMQQPPRAVAPYTANQSSPAFASINTALPPPSFPNRFNQPTAQTEDLSLDSKKSVPSQNGQMADMSVQTSEAQPRGSKRTWNDIEEAGVARPNAALGALALPMAKNSTCENCSSISQRLASVNKRIETLTLKDADNSFLYSQFLEMHENFKTSMFAVVGPDMAWKINQMLAQAELSLNPTVSSQDTLLTQINQAILAQLHSTEPQLSGILNSLINNEVQSYLTNDSASSNLATTLSRSLRDSSTLPRRDSNYAQELAELLQEHLPALQELTSGFKSSTPTSRTRAEDTNTNNVISSTSSGFSIGPTNTPSINVRTNLTKINNTTNSSFSNVPAQSSQPVNTPSSNQSLNMNMGPNNGVNIPSNSMNVPRINNPGSKVPPNNPGININSNNQNMPGQNTNNPRQATNANMNNSMPAGQMHPNNMNNPRMNQPGGMPGQEMNMQPPNMAPRNPGPYHQMVQQQPMQYMPNNQMGHNPYMGPMAGPPHGYQNLGGHGHQGYLPQFQQGYHGYNQGYQPGPPMQHGYQHPIYPNQGPNVRPGNPNY